MYAFSAMPTQFLFLFVCFIVDAKASSIHFLLPTQNYEILKPNMVKESSTHEWGSEYPVCDTDRWASKYVCTNDYVNEMVLVGLFNPSFDTN